MIKKNQRYFNWINRLLDMAVLCMAYCLAVWLWLIRLGHDSGNPALRILTNAPGVLLLASFCFVVVFQYGGMYDSQRFRTLWAELMQLLKLFVLCAALLFGAVFMLKLPFSRGVLSCFTIFGYVLLSLKRVLLRLVLRAARRSGYNQKHMLIVGDGRLAQKYAAAINENPRFGCQCIGYVGRHEAEGMGKHLGAYEDLALLIDRYSPDEVIIALEQDEIGQLNTIIADCEEQGVRANIVPIYNDYLPSCATVDVVGDVRLINIRAIPQDVMLNRAVKRAFDIVFSCAAIIITSPVLLITALGVRLSGPGPVLFRQTRVGRDRKPFTMLKFRSMRTNTESDTAWSTDHDSRVTPFGAFIRKFSIDELPQFFNVLRGDMSVVGPRPELPYFVDKYKYKIPRYMVKHQVKPGITGWAQVNGYRGDTSLERRIEYDLWYIENWSILLDIKIIFMTVFGGMINSEKNLRREEQKV